MRTKLALDPGSTLQRKLLKERGAICVEQHNLLDAFVCADLLRDIDLQVSILQKSVDVGEN